MDHDEVLARVTHAARQVAEKDADLLQLDANERTLTHRLAIYLEGEFPGWHVDCEYNRNRHDPKVLKLPVEHDVSSDDTDARTVFPDVIVHRRGTSDNVVEAKKTTSQPGRADDRTKLRAYVRQLHYRHAIFVVFSTSGEHGIASIECIEP